MTDKELGTAAGDIFAKAFTLGYETGRKYVPAGGMALTAEQVEDVEALVATANPYSAPAARLRALFPATEPAEDAKPCGSNSVTLGWCKLTARHEGLHTNGTYLWGTPSEPDPPAPAEPAEEETKADLCAVRLCVLPAEHSGVHADREGLRWNTPSSSPVVPASTETGPQTLEGPWDRIEDVPETVGRLTDRDGDIWEWDGDNWVTPETAILPTTYINRKFAPFVAAEEG